jgi:hypothetical protein
MLHRGKWRTRRTASARRKQSPPPTDANTILNQRNPNQEHQITYQPQLRMGYAIARSTAQIRYHLAIGKARGSKNTNTVRILTAVATPGVHERRPEGELQHLQLPVEGTPGGRGGRKIKRREMEGRQRVPASAVLAHT